MIMRFPTTFQEARRRSVERRHARRHTSGSIVAGLSAACLVALVILIHGVGTPRSYTIDPAHSRATVEVGKSGVFSFAAGHTHEVEARTIAGTLTVDVDDPARSTVHITVDASALRVTGKGESADDVPKVQETMAGAQVLDVRSYPTITFASTSIAVKGHTPTALETLVSGKLTIRNVTHPISVPVSVHIDGQMLSATGRFPVKQSEFGMKPVSVGGVVSVKDTVNVSFAIEAR
jgi:polyisoprenoid-binding protein YceI